MKLHKIITIASLILLASCSTTMQKTQAYKANNISVYVLGKEHISSSFGFMNYSGGSNIYQRKYDKQSKVPKTHFNTVSYFLWEYLSVTDQNWHQKMFYKGEVFWPLDLDDIAKRNLGQEESFQVIKKFHIEYDSTVYEVLKIKHQTFSGDEEILRMNLIYENDRFYLIEDFDNEELKEIMDTFYRVKNEIGIELTKAAMQYDFPPSGNATRDNYLHNEIYYNFGVGYGFNITRFIYTTKQWEAEGKTGLLNYFFEK